MIVFSVRSFKNFRCFGHNFPLIIRKSVYSNGSSSVQDQISHVVSCSSHIQFEGQHFTTVSSNMHKNTKTSIYNCIRKYVSHLYCQHSKTLKNTTLSMTRTKIPRLRSTIALAQKYVSHLHCKTLHFLCCQHSKTQ